MSREQVHYTTAHSYYSLFQPVAGLSYTYTVNNNYRLYNMIIEIIIIMSVILVTPNAVYIIGLLTGIPTTSQRSMKDVIKNVQC